MDFAERIDCLVVMGSGEASLELMVLLMGGKGGLGAWPPGNFCKTTPYKLSEKGATPSKRIAINIAIKKFSITSKCDGSFSINFFAILDKSQLQSLYLTFKQTNDFESVVYLHCLIIPMTG